MPSAPEIERRLEAFRGAQTQVPPMYSALKHKGRRLYEHARAGETVEREPRPIVVHDIALVESGDERFTLDVRVSGGTYVRTLVEDIAASWGGAAHVDALRRTAIGPLGTQRPMVALETIEAPSAAADWLLPLSILLADWPRVRLDSAATLAIGHGRPVNGGGRETSDRLLCIEAADGGLLGLGQIDAERRLVPKRLFARPQR